MRGYFGLASWLVIVLIGSLWILPESSRASPVPIEGEQIEIGTTNRPQLFSGLRSGFDRLGAGIRSKASAVKETMMNAYEYSVVRIKDGVAVLNASLNEEISEGPPPSAPTKNNDSLSDDGQFVFPEVDTSEVAFAEERKEFDEHTASSTKSTTTPTTSTTTMTKDDHTTKSPAKASDVHPDEVVETSTDGLSLDDRSLFDVPEKSKCDSEKQRTAKDGSCRTAIKQ